MKEMLEAPHGGGHSEKPTSRKGGKEKGPGILRALGKEIMKAAESGSEAIFDPKEHK